MQFRKQHIRNLIICSNSDSEIGALDLYYTRIYILMSYTYTMIYIYMIPNLSKPQEHGIDSKR